MTQPGNTLRHNTLIEVVLPVAVVAAVGAGALGGCSWECHHGTNCVHQSKDDKKPSSGAHNERHHSTSNGSGHLSFKKSLQQHGGWKAELNVGPADAAATFSNARKAGACGSITFVKSGHFPGTSDPGWKTDHGLPDNATQDYAASHLSCAKNASLTGSEGTITPAVYATAEQGWEATRFGHITGAAALLETIDHDGPMADTVPVPVTA